MIALKLSSFLKRLGEVVGTETSPKPIIQLQFLLRHDDEEFAMGKTYGINTYIYRVGDSSVDWAKVANPGKRTEWFHRHIHHEVLELLPPRRSVRRNHCLPILRVD